MRTLIILSMALLSLSVFEKPAEAGFFRMGPIRRFLFFGGPIRRRMFGRPMMRRPFCGNCMPRRIPGRCGPGNHGGRCFNNQNFRNFRDFRDFQNFRNQNLRNFNRFDDPLFRQDQFNSTPDFGIGLTQAPVPQTSAVVRNPEEDFRKKFLEGQEPSKEVITSASWSGSCQSSSGGKREMIFALPEEASVVQRDRSLFFTGSESEKLWLRTNSEGSQLYMMRRAGEQRGEEFCLLERH